MKNSLASDPNEDKLAELKAKFEQITDLYRHGRIEAAERICFNILADYPGHPTATVHLGVIATLRNDMANAVAIFRRVCARYPMISMAEINLAIAWLKMGNFAEGLKAFERRLDLAASDTKTKQKISLPELSFPIWNGEPVEGKRILLVREQGSGDQIQFIRFATDLAAKGAHVDFLTRPPLQRLLKTAPGIGEILTETPEGGYDFWLPVMSLAHRLGVRMEHLPGVAIPYLFPDQDEIAKWSELLTDYAKGRPKVGLVWAGSPSHLNDRFRSMGYPRVKALLDEMPDVAFVSLQIGPSVVRQKEDVEAGRLLPIASQVQDFMETAAVVSKLDLVIGVDTSVLHLAGALGRPCWMMLPFDSDWRWLRYRDDSPWYPSMRLFRQHMKGSWATMMAEVTKELKKWAVFQTSDDLTRKNDF
jgi:hypothetical protein